MESTRCPDRTLDDSFLSEPEGGHGKRPCFAASQADAHPEKYKPGTGASLLLGRLYFEREYNAFEFAIYRNVLWAVVRAFDARVRIVGADISPLGHWVNTSLKMTFNDE